MTLALSSPRRPPYACLLVAAVATLVALAGTAQTPIAAPAPGFKESDLYEIIDRATRSPRAPETLQPLNRASTQVTDKALAEPLLCAVALGLHLQHQDNASAVLLKNIRDRFPDSTYADRLAPAKLRQECAACKGTGETSVKCPKCGGDGKCANSKCKGGKVTLQFVNKRTEVQPCPVCKGTGKCAACEGTGKRPDACPTCHGAKNLPDADKVAAAYKDLLAVCRLTLGNRSGVQAAEFLITSQVQLWQLRSLALNEARKALISPEAHELVTRHMTDSTRAEQSLRDLARSRRSPLLKQAARDFAGTFDTETQKFVTATVKRLGDTQEDFLLDWLTFDAAMNFCTVAAAWQHQGNVRDAKDREFLANALRELTEPPRIEKGCQLTTRTSTSLSLSAYGVTLTDDVLPDQASVEDTQVTVKWRSGSYRLQQLVASDTAEELSEAEIERDKTRFTRGFVPPIEGFVTHDQRLPWATCLADADVTVLGQVVREERALAAGNTDRHVTESKRFSTGLAVLPDIVTGRLATLPVVQIAAVGLAFGSGFLIEFNGDWFVVTNRHLVEGADQGFRVYLNGAGDGADRQIVFEVAATGVAAIHASADLALLKVNPQKALLQGKGIIPLTLADTDATAAVGAFVMVPVHPDEPQEGQAANCAAAPGIVTGNRYAAGYGSCLMLTAPVSAPNCGSPVLDCNGKVVGVATLELRPYKKGLVLEPLALAVKSAALRDLLEKRETSLSRADIALRTAPAVTQGATNETAERTRAQDALANLSKELTAKGFRPVNNKLGDGASLTLVRPEETRQKSFSGERGRDYALVAAWWGSGNVTMAVQSLRGEILGAESGAGPAQCNFKTWNGAAYTIVLQNAAAKQAAYVSFALFER